jgi:hypothetical protein
VIAIVGLYVGRPDNWAFVGSFVAGDNVADKGDLAIEGLVVGAPEGKIQKSATLKADEHPPILIDKESVFIATIGNEVSFPTLEIFPLNETGKPPTTTEVAKLSTNCFPADEMKLELP